MTARGMLEALLIELNKVNAPSLLLEDYNYFINKAINQYINKQYNFNDVNQQYADNVRVLKSTAILTPEKSTAYGSGNTLYSNIHNATYEVNLPGDYLHILNCICIYEVQNNYKCYKRGDYVPFAAKRLTSDSWSTILNDYYNKPTYKRPYYYIHNVNKVNDGTLPTNPYSPENTNGTDFSRSSYEAKKEAIIELLLAGTLTANQIKPEHWDKQIQHIDVDATYEAHESVINKYIETANNVDKNGIGNIGTFPTTIPIGGVQESVVDKQGGLRFGNPLPSIRCEIRCGTDTTVFDLKQVQVDYIKTPQFICITQEQMDLTQDTSQIMEFPDYVCQEIINELVHLVMENGSDQRLQTHIPVSQSIASPAQQQAAK